MGLGGDYFRDAALNHFNYRESGKSLKFVDLEAQCCGDVRLVK
jgi:hypothetical protein